MCCLRGANKSSMHNFRRSSVFQQLLLVEHDDWVKCLYARLNHVFNTLNRRQEVVLFQYSLSLISIPKKNIYSASIITLLSKQRTHKNTEGVVITVVENKI
jgi:hypothetical protein